MSQAEESKVPFQSLDGNCRWHRAKTLCVQRYAHMITYILLFRYVHVSTHHTICGIQKVHAWISQHDDTKCEDISLVPMICLYVLVEETSYGHSETNCLLHTSFGALQCGARWNLARPATEAQQSHIVWIAEEIACSQ